MKQAKLTYSVKSQVGGLGDCDLRGIRVGEFWDPGQVLLYDLYVNYIGVFNF